MRNRAALIAVLLLAATAGAGAQPDPFPRLVVNVYTRNDHGRVFCALWRGPDGFPTERNRAVGQTLDRTIINHTAQCVFDRVHPGEYAVAVFHDENANNNLDRNFLGIPSEGTGASNGARPQFGPPRYRDARFQFPRVRQHIISIRVLY